MFDLANYFASANSTRMAMTNSKSSSSSDETASTSSVSSDITPGSSRSNVDGYNNNQTKQKHNKYTPSNASTSNDIYSEDQEEEEEEVHIPPKIAFQIFELIELKRRCKGLYRRHQEKRRQSVIKAANNSTYHSITSGFESYSIDGELFV
jgi:hypothetical protein